MIGDLWWGSYRETYIFNILFDLYRHILFDVRTYVQKSCCIIWNMYKVTARQDSDNIPESSSLVMNRN